MSIIYQNGFLFDISYYIESFYDVASGSDIMPCKNRLTVRGLQNSVTLYIDVRKNNVAYILVWQNISVFTQKTRFQISLRSYDK